MEYLGVSLFFGVTLGHFLLTPYWLKRAWGRSFSGPEEFSFQSLVFGFGSLQAVLHTLACTVGISLIAGIGALVAVHLLVYACLRRAPNPATRGADAVAASPIAAPQAVGRTPTRRAKGRLSQEQSGQRATLAWAALSRFPLPTVLGAVAIATCVLSWLLRSPQSMQILGIDSFHYHVPYAVNYAHGINLFGYLATPHLYPVGASILGAWFFQPFSDPLLLDLVNLLPFLLLLVSLVYLFRLLTDEPGWEWAPIMVLLLFTGKMFRVSLFISADMLYAASFAAVFTQLCGMWFYNKADAYDWLSLSIATGMLLSSKIQGTMSAVLLLTCYAIATAVQFGMRRDPPRLSWSFGLLATGTVLLLASGGIWLIRNWLYFGSPLAPTGLTIFGVRIFAGAPAASDWLSIAKDMKDNPGYDLLNRFLVRSRDWVGLWPAFLSAGLVALLMDVIYQLATQRRLSVVLRRKLFALLFFALLFTVHAYILIQAPGSSIEILYGQTLRYVIPFYALYSLLAYAFLFSDALPWVRYLHLKWFVLVPGLVYVLYAYNGLTQMPIEWNRAHGTENLVDYRLMPLALVLVAPWCVPLGTWRRAVQYGCAAVLALCLIAFVGVCGAQDAQLTAAAGARLRQEVQRFQRGGAATPYRGVFLRVVDYQSKHNASCTRSRFFMMSRFDFPLDLQDPHYDNLVFDMQDGNTRIQWLLERDGPGEGACDYVVAAHQEIIAGDTKLPAVSEDDIKRLLPLRGTLEAIGDSGGYRAYHVRRS